MYERKEDVCYFWNNLWIGLDILKASSIHFIVSINIVCFFV
jgi:hypothetical protein